MRKLLAKKRELEIALNRIKRLRARRE